jgi:hypothetical protein
MGSSHALNIMISRDAEAVYPDECAAKPAEAAQFADPLGEAVRHDKRRQSSRRLQGLFVHAEALAGSPLALADGGRPGSEGRPNSLFVSRADPPKFSAFLPFLPVFFAC